MRYQVKHHSEEFECPTCGEPVLVGDTAWEEPDGSMVVCFLCRVRPGKTIATASKKPLPTVKNRTENFHGC